MDNTYIRHPYENRFWFQACRVGDLGGGKPHTIRECFAVLRERVEG